MKVENQILRERIKKLTLQLYGRKSEKYVLEDEESFDQKSLFEDHDGFVENDCVVDDAVALVSVPGHKRKKGGTAYVKGGSSYSVYVCRGKL